MTLRRILIEQSEHGQDHDIGPITLENVEPPAAIAPNVPFAQAFSLQRTARYLDQAALNCAGCLFPNRNLLSSAPGESTGP